MRQIYDRLRRARLFRDLRGAAAVEFALLAPVLITMFFIASEGANILLAANKTQSAADSVADLIAQQTSVTAASLGDIFHAGELIMAPFAPTPFGVAASSVRFDPVNGSASVSWQQALRSPMVANATSLSTGLGDKGESVIIVRAKYVYTPLFTTLITSATVELSKTAVVRPRLRPFIPLT